MGKNDKIWLMGKVFPDKKFSKTIFPGYFHSLKRSIFYLLCFHELRYKYEAALSVYSKKIKSSSSGKNHQGNVCISPSKKTLCYFRTQMLSLLSNTSKVHLVKGMMIPYEKGNLSFCQELSLFIQLLFVGGVVFIIILQKSCSKKTSPQINASEHLGFAIFILRYQQLYRKLKQNPKQVLNLPSVKTFMNSVQAKRSALEGLRFYYQDIRLNRYKAAKKSLVSSCVRIVEGIIACFQSRYDSLESVGRENQTDSISAREGDTIILVMFSQMKVVKTDLRNRLNKRNLEDLLRIKISNVSLSKFSKKIADSTLTIWASKKQCRLSKENANIVRELQQVQRSLGCKPWVGFYKRMLTINEHCS